MLKQERLQMRFWSCKQPNLLPSSGRGSTGTILGWYRDAERHSKLLQFLLRLQYSSNLGLGSAETSKWIQTAQLTTLKRSGVPLVRSRACVGILDLDSKLLQFLLRLQYGSNLGWGSAETRKASDALLELQTA